MPQYAYMIGTSYGDLTNVESLSGTPLPPPKSDFKPFATSVVLASGKSRGLGFPVATWNFGYLRQAQRDRLRQFCTGTSADIWIKTRTNDSADTFSYFQGVMNWPEDEETEHRLRPDFVVTFTHLVLYTPP